MYLIVDKKTKAPKVAFHSRKQAFRYKAKYGADVVSLMYYGQLCRKKYREKRRQKKFMRLVRKRDRLNRIIAAMRRGMPTQEEAGLGSFCGKIVERN